MKRDPRLQCLSSDHHHALVLARSLTTRRQGWTRGDGEALGARFDDVLEPHFRVEEDVLLPALRCAGQTALVDRTEAEHTDLRSLVATARGGDGQAAHTFGLRLHDHVRFEERELFPACEALGDEVLEEVARRAPEGSRGRGETG